MDICFANNKLQKACTNKKDATRRYGADNAQKLMRRLDQLRAASNLEDIWKLFNHTQGRYHELEGNRHGQLSLDLRHPFRLIFEPLGNNIHKQDGGLDASLITAVRIINVEDPHG